MNITLTYQEGTSNKFYTLKLEDKTLEIHYGRIGSAGQRQLKKFKTGAEALKEYEKLLAEKRKKGYVEEGGGGSEESASSSSESGGDEGAGGTAKSAAGAKANAAAKGATKANGKAGVHAKAEPVAAEAAETVERQPAGPPSPLSRILGKAVPSAPAAAKAGGATAGAQPAARARPAGPPLPAPALEDPPVPGLDLAVWRHATVPVPERDPTPFPSGDFVIEGYTISFGEDEEVFVNDAKGKRLKSVPDKLRKHDDYQALMRGRKDDRSRGRRARRVLEDRMIAGTPLLAEEIAWLVEDDAFAPLLRGLIIHPSGRPKEASILLSWDKTRGLGVLPPDYDARWIGWPAIELAHPMRLGDVILWQDLLVDLGHQQGLVQAFREVKNVPQAQRKLTESSMLSGRETSSASAIERTLMEEGWIARRGMAKRKLALRTEAGLVAVEAWFDYGEYYMPGEPTYTGSFGFNSAATGRPIKMNEVPDILLSETIRSLELCLAQAGAKKDEEEEGEGGEESESEDADSDDDGDDDT